MHVSGFIGREKEINVLKTALEEQYDGICVYGPRRVGKTALIKQVLSGMDPSSVIYFESTRSSYEYNMELFAREAARVLERPYVAKLTDIFDMFDAIVREAGGRHMTVVIDEYPYMRERLGEAVLDSFFQRIIDTHAGRISIVLSGSYMTEMKEMLEEGMPLFGRIGRVISLKPFSYLDAARFYPDLPVRDKIAFYAVFGGYPFVLRYIDEEKTLFENIARLLLDEGTMVRSTLENVLLSEAGKSGVPSELLARIGNGKMRFSEIEDLMSGDVSGTLDRSLKRLIGMGILDKVSPINKKNDKKKTFYEIKDNLLRFYFTYIVPNAAMIARTEAREFFDVVIAPSLDTFISRRFEGIVNEYFTLTAGASALDIGTYWYDDRKTHTNGEFDAVIKARDGSYKVFEVKYLKRPMSEDLYHEERAKAEAIHALDISGYGVVSSSGFAFDTSKYQDTFIDGDALYHNEK